MAGSVQAAAVKSATHNQQNNLLARIVFIRPLSIFFAAIAKRDRLAVKRRQGRSPTIGWGCAHFPLFWFPL
jgi:hypothetical protein